MYALIGGRAFFSFVRRAKYERTSTEQPSESSRFDDDADDDGTQSRPSCSFGRRPSTEPRSSTKMYPNLTPCAATSPDASVGYPCASGARHTEAYCSSLSWNGTKPGPADDDGRGDGVSRRLSSISLSLLALSRSLKSLVALLGGAARASQEERRPGVYHGGELISAHAGKPTPRSSA